MAVTIDVPVNTLLADLDASLRTLLRDELRGRGFDGVDVSFDAPTREWAAALTGPTVDLFLFDLREAEELRRSDWIERRDGDHGRRERPPLIIDCSYAVTAWTREVEDEHRLLSQVLAILYAHTVLPPAVLAGGLADVARETPLHARSGRFREKTGPEFWTALGGQYKASVPYTVTLPWAAGVTVAAGPPVRSQTLGLRPVDRPGSVELRHRTTGTVRTAAGAPVADAWVVVEGAGAWAATAPDGRFTIDSAPAGRHRCSVRAPDGAEGEGELVVPGPGVDLVVETVPRRRRA